MNDIEKILVDVLTTAAGNDFSGYSKFDALNSPLLLKLSFNNKWLRLLYTQAVKSSPINIRSFLRIKKSRNPKGIALFVRAYFFLYEKTGNSDWLDAGESLLKWLLDHPSKGVVNLCWGYNFIWQNTIFLQAAFEPNAVVTVFVGEALIHAYRITKKQIYLDAAKSVAEFIVSDLPILYESENERAIAYVLRKVDAVVLNNQVLTGAFLAKIWSHIKENRILDCAVKQLNYTVNRRTDYNCWYYTEPKNKSPITHDNYHTGGILDGLLEYFEETGDDRFMPVYWNGLKYYQISLFEPDGAPRWMHDKKYPLDIHGSAQGIITFMKSSRYKEEYTSQALGIYNWSIRHLYRKSMCDFAYRQSRFFKWDYSLMRWCNAWMARAIGELISRPTHTSMQANISRPRHYLR
jgi:rhamnogalacturonyl hydrolase YesR